MASLIEIFGWFETGDIPTQDQFRTTFASFRHKENKIPLNEVEGLAAIFENTVTNNIFNGFKDDVNSKIINLAKKDGSNLLPADVISWKKALGLANIAVVDSEDDDETVIIGNVYTKKQVIGMLEVFREQVNGSYQTIEEIKEMLVSNDLDLDELQEIVNFIKKNREDIELLKQISVGNTKDDKVELVANYARWGALNLQNQFNDVVYDKIQAIESGAGTRETIIITDDSFFTHNLNSYDFVCEAYDTVTLYKLPLKIKIVDANNIYIAFDSKPTNNINVTIKKI
ncbi:hypothetical protein AB670_02746 [Chryseobacterium sp. MOF25P]|uniref:hypothetical protein n=1 Tax=unclassified Chryseobacterium TaxID=2593645 RepID=UPI000805FB83|nr:MULTISPECIES: hypothetical protein [unclassified Chryseobacterium]OBW40795.1 hypothetical protein AB670_02746 [Chryseobacterium sp. MOF25P]OBW45259.1 hypothetical protein AB671_02556 [Chryseobacterium sp. BGARF1]